MYKAIIYYTIGWGLDTKIAKSDSYKGINDIVNEWVNTNNHKMVTVLGKSSNVTIEKIVFQYPSGKSFTKRGF